MIARYGGDEFVFLLPDTEAAGAERILETVRMDIQARQSEKDTVPPITISVGIAAAVPRAFDSCEHLIGRADKELYRAKQSGRNRISSEAAVA